MWKLNNPRVMSKPPVLAEVDPIKHEIGSTTVVTGWSIANTGANSMMVGEAVSMLVDAVMPMMVGDVVLMSMADDVMSMTGDAESTAVAGDEPSILVDAGELMEAIDARRSMVVGEGAGKSIDPDPVVPTVSAN
jgi:hypothetical protein